MIMFAAIVAGSISAQNNNPKREVLFTLGEHEVIVYDEYMLGMALNGYKFAAIVKDTQTSKFSLVFNGKRVYETKSLPYKGNEGAYWFGEGYPHPHSPHVIPHLAFNVLFINPAIENGYAYWYTLAGRRFFNVMGKVTSGAPGISNDASIADNGKFAFRYQENDKEYANIDGTIFGPYQSVWDCAIANNGKFAFRYRENDKEYANIDGTIFGPYQHVWHIATANNGKFAFAYQENDKEYANIDGTIFGPYQYVSWSVAIADNGKFAFAYKENDKWHYNIHGNEVSESAWRIAWKEIREKISRPYFHVPDEKIINDIRSKDGKHMFYSDWEYDYVVVDGKEIDTRPAINAYYDEQKNAFIWNAIEGKELVVYEYKL
jgi:hypothetical protein